MNKKDIEIFQFVNKAKALDDLYLGYIEYGWKFAVVDYIADRTKYLPLNVFDNAICKLLSLDGELSFSQIGEILGLNLEEDIANNIYKDEAEIDLLTKAITSLMGDYKMIQAVAGEKFRLTQVGVDNMKAGKKSITDPDLTFTLFYDLTSNEHSSAKKVFGSIEGEEYSSTPTPELEDVEKVKIVLEKQQPSTFNSSAGDQIANVNIENCSLRTLNINIAVTYNTESKEYKYYVYAPYAKTYYFEETIQNNSKLRDILLQAVLNKKGRVSQKPSELQKSYQEVLKQTQEKIDASKRKKAEILESFMSSRKIFEPEYFWNLDNGLMSTDYNEVIMVFPQFSRFESDFLAKLSNAHPNTNYFIEYCTTDEKFEDYYSNVYFVKIPKIESPVFCICDATDIWQNIDFIHTSGSENRVIPMVQKRSVESYDVEPHKRKFAQKLLRKIFEDAFEELNSHFDADQKSIDYLKSLDEKILQFGNNVDALGFREQLVRLQRKRDSILVRLRSGHEQKLLERLQMLTKTEIEDIVKKASLVNLREQLELLRQDGYGDYPVLEANINSFIDRIDKQEQYLLNMILAKTYVIDTNVFIDDPRVISYTMFQDKVILSLKVYDELDKHKTNEDPRVRQNASEAFKQIKRELDKNKQHVRSERSDLKLLPSEYSHRNADNMILALAVAHKDDNICMLTSDTGFRVKADGLGIPTMSLTEFKEHVELRKAEIQKLKDKQESQNKEYEKQAKSKKKSKKRK